MAAGMAKARTLSEASAQIGPLSTVHRFAWVGSIEGAGFQSIEVTDGLAYVTDSTAGLIVFDVSDPGAPREVGRAAVRGPADDVVLDGDIALVASVGDSLSLVDVSDPTAPLIIGRYSYGDAEQAIAAKDGIGLIADDRDLRLFEFATPNTPRTLGRIEMDFFGPQDIAVSGSLAYSAQHWDRLSIVDVGDPSAPVIRGVVGEKLYVAGRSIALDGTTAYLGELLHGSYFIPTPPPYVSPTPGPSPTGPTPTPTPLATPPPDGGRLSVVDVSDPNEPIVIGQSEAFYYQPIVGVHVSDGLAWLSSQPTLRNIVLDVTDPENIARATLEVDPPRGIGHLIDAASDGDFTLSYRAKPWSSSKGSATESRRQHLDRRGRPRPRPAPRRRPTSRPAPRRPVNRVSRSSFL